MLMSRFWLDAHIHFIIYISGMKLIETDVQAILF